MKLSSVFLAPYLPYKLNIEYAGGRRVLIGIQDPTSWSNHLSICVEEGLWISGYKIVPFLRSAEDLIKPIEHNGETFIPLVRLAELHGWEDSVKIEEQNGTYIVFGDTAIHPGNGETMGRYFFEIDSEDFDIDWGFENVCGGSTFYPVKNQILLYEKLLEWNFDIYKLIDEGLAKRL